MDELVESASSDTRDVTVFMDGHDPVDQPSSFKFCPLGLQFSSPKELRECQLMDFNLQVPGETGDKKISCSGIVCHCHKEPEGAMYRVWVKFLDLPAEMQKQIETLTCKSSFLCPYCENY